MSVGVRLRRLLTICVIFQIILPAENLKMQVNNLKSTPKQVTKLESATKTTNSVAPIPQLPNTAQLVPDIVLLNTDPTILQHNAFPLNRNAIIQNNALQVTNTPTLLTKPDINEEAVKQLLLNPNYVVDNDFNTNYNARGDAPFPIVPYIERVYQESPINNLFTLDINNNMHGTPKIHSNSEIVIDIPSSSVVNHLRPIVNDVAGKENNVLAYNNIVLPEIVIPNIVPTNLLNHNLDDIQSNSKTAVNMFDKSYSGLRSNDNNRFLPFSSQYIPSNVPDTPCYAQPTMNPTENNFVNRPYDIPNTCIKKKSKGLRRKFNTKSTAISNNNINCGPTIDNNIEIPFNNQVSNLNMNGNNAQVLEQINPFDIASNDITIPEKFYNKLPTNLQEPIIPITTSKTNMNKSINRNNVDNFLYALKKMVPFNFENVQPQFNEPCNTLKTQLPEQIESNILSNSAQDNYNSVNEIERQNMLPLVINPEFFNALSSVVSSSPNKVVVDKLSSPLPFIKPADNFLDVKPYLTQPNYIVPSTSSLTENNINVDKNDGLSSKSDPRITIADTNLLIATPNALSNCAVTQTTTDKFINIPTIITDQPKVERTVSSRIDFAKKNMLATISDSKINVLQNNDLPPNKVFPTPEIIFTNPVTEGITSNQDYILSLGKSSDINLINPVLSSYCNSINEQISLVPTILQSSSLPSKYPSNLNVDTNISLLGSSSQIPYPNQNNPSLRTLNRNIELKGNNDNLDLNIPVLVPSLLNTVGVSNSLQNNKNVQTNNLPTFLDVKPFLPDSVETPVVQKDICTNTNNDIVPNSETQFIVKNIFVPENINNFERNIAAMYPNFNPYAISSNSYQTNEVTITPDQKQTLISQNVPTPYGFLTPPVDVSNSLPNDDNLVKTNNIPTFLDVTPFLQNSLESPVVQNDLRIPIENVVSNSLTQSPGTSFEPVIVVPENINNFETKAFLPSSNIKPYSTPCNFYPTNDVTTTSVQNPILINKNAPTFNGLMPKPIDISNNIPKNKIVQTNNLPTFHDVKPFLANFVDNPVVEKDLSTPINNNIVTNPLTQSLVTNLQPKICGPDNTNSIDTNVVSSRPNINSYSLPIQTPTVIGQNVPTFNGVLSTPTVVAKEPSPRLSPSNIVSPMLQETNNERNNNNVNTLGVNYSSNQNILRSNIPNIELNTFVSNALPNDRIVQTNRLPQVLDVKPYLQNIVDKPVAQNDLRTPINNEIVLNSPKQPLVTSSQPGNTNILNTNKVLSSPTINPYSLPCNPYTTSKVTATPVQTAIKPNVIGQPVSTSNSALPKPRVVAKESTTTPYNNNVNYGYPNPISPVSYLPYVYTSRKPNVQKQPTPSITYRNITPQNCLGTQIDRLLPTQEISNSIIDLGKAMAKKGLLTLLQRKAQNVPPVVSLPPVNPYPSNIPSYSPMMSIPLQLSMLSAAIQEPQAVSSKLPSFDFHMPTLPTKSVEDFENFQIPDFLSKMSLPNLNTDFVNIDIKDVPNVNINLPEIELEDIPNVSIEIPEVEIDDIPYIKTDLFNTDSNEDDTDYETPLTIPYISSLKINIQPIVNNSTIDNCRPISEYNTYKFPSPSYLPNINIPNYIAPQIVEIPKNNRNKFRDKDLKRLAMLMVINELINGDDSELDGLQTLLALMFVR